MESFLAVKNVMMARLIRNFLPRHVDPIVSGLDVVTWCLIRAKIAIWVILTLMILAASVALGAALEHALAPLAKLYLHVAQPKPARWYLRNQPVDTVPCIL
jgi:hypothetical protein